MVREFDVGNYTRNVPCIRSRYLYLSRYYFIHFYRYIYQQHRYCIIILIFQLFSLFLLRQLLYLFNYY